MPFYLLLVVLAALGRGQVSPGIAAKPPIHLATGDSLRIFLTANLVSSAVGTGTAPIRPDPATTQTPTSDPYQGVFVVQSDGCIYGVGFGRLKVEGETVDEAQTSVRHAMRKLVKESEVFVTLDEQREQHVFIVGGGIPGGTLKLTPGLSLRQALSKILIERAGIDLTEAQVFRNGAKIETVNLQDFLRSGPDLPLEADDIVSVSPQPVIRIWVTGAVKNPGRVAVPEGARLSEVLAAAGGPIDLANSTPLPGGYSVVLQRGSESHRYPLDFSNPDSWPTVEPGDTVSVIQPVKIHVVVSGEVTKPGEVFLTSKDSASAAIALAGGPTLEASLSNVMVIRNNQMTQINAEPKNTPDPDHPAPMLEDGDLVVVQKNEAAFYVFGSVNKAGKFLIPDGKTFRASDALALAQGLKETGTYRRVYIVRADAKGVYKTMEFNLDEYLKDGNLKGNPIVLPGDSLLFSNAKPSLINVASQVISSLFLLNSVGVKF